MSSIGRLLLPFTQILWGDLDLSAWEYGSDDVRPVVFGAEFSLQAGDNKINNASFQFDPSPVGFRAYTQCISEKYLTQPIKIRFGYENGDFIEVTYFFQDVEFVTGSQQSIKVTVAGLHKQAMTSSWWSEYVGDSTNEFSIKDLWDTMVTKIGYEMVWSDGALKKLDEAPLIQKASIQQEPIGTFLIRTADEYGFYLEWPTGSEEDNKKVLVKTGALDDKKRNALKVIETYKSKGKTKQGSERLNERQAFILGPTLVNRISRRTKPQKSTSSSSPDTAYSIRTGATQDLNSGQLYTKSTRRTSSRSGKSSGGSSSPLSSQATTDIGQLQSASQQQGEQVSSAKKSVSGVQPVASPTALEQVEGGQAQNNPPGVSSPSGLDTQRLIDGNGQKLKGAALEEEQKKQQDAKNTKKLGEYSECSCDVFMVPYMVGIQPKDFILFPSLSADEPYIEDWEVKTVSYKQQGGAIVISITGVRPKPGADSLIDEKDLKKLQKRVTSMTTPKQWENYYWNYA